jgi:hypothetical protein
MTGVYKVQMTVANLCLFIMTMSIRVSGAIITVESIQAEGLACIEMAKAIPGLQNIAGTIFESCKIRQLDTPICCCQSFYQP